MNRRISLLNATLLLILLAGLPLAGAEQPDDVGPAQEAEAQPKRPPIVLTEADAGQTIEAAVGQEVVVRLKGNPTTGFRWEVEAVEGEAVEPRGEVAYEPPHTARLGAGGTFVARFQAARQGEATLAMRYVRPWEKDKEPAETFRATVKVAGETEGQAVRIVKQWQGSRGGRTPGRRVIATPQTFRAAWKAPGRGEPPEVDFARHTVLLVDLGMRNTGGYAVTIESVELKEGKVVATVRSTAPGPRDIVTQALTSPWCMAEIDVAGKEVEFVEAERPDGARRPGKLPPRRIPRRTLGRPPRPQDR